MADAEAPDKEIYLSRVIRLQALFRGALVRKQIEDVKQSFEALFAELEGNDTQEVDWESLLGFPKVVKKGHKKVKSSAVQCQTTLPSKENKALLPKKESVIKKDDDRHSAKFCSVEVQTSFIDVTTAKRNEKDSPVRNDDCDNILDDLDTSWKDRVVPFIQNNDFQSEPHHDNVEDFHLDLESDRDKSDNHSAKSENSARRASKYSPREVGSNSRHTSPRSITSVKSINDNRIESFEHSEDDIIKTPTSDRPTKSEQKIENIDSSRSRRQVNDGYSEKRDSNRPRSGQRYNQERSDFDTENRLNKQTSNNNDHRNDRHENSGQQNSVPLSSRSQNSARLNQNSDPDLPKVNSSRSRTSNKSDRSDNDKRNNDDRYSDRVRNIDGEHRNVSSRQEHSDGGGTNRSDRSTERAKLSDRSDRSGGWSQRSDRSREPPQHSDWSTERGQRSNRADKSGEQSRGSNRSAENTPRSDRSTEQKLNSARSDGSVDDERQSSDRSDRSNEAGPSSNRSGGRSRASSTGSRKSEPTTKNNADVLRPQRSSVSPVAFRSKSPDNQHHIQDSTTLTNVTSVWDSVNSMRGSQLAQVSSPLPEDANSLRELRKNLSMELLWVQQAIDSRKNYLKLKGKM